MGLRAIATCKVIGIHPSKPRKPFAGKGKGYDPNVRESAKTMAVRNAMSDLARKLRAQGYGAYSRDVRCASRAWDETIA